MFDGRWTTILGPGNGEQCPPIPGPQPCPPCGQSGWPTVAIIACWLAVFVFLTCSGTFLLAYCKLFRGRVQALLNRRRDPPPLRPAQPQHHVVDVPAEPAATPLESAHKVAHRAHLQLFPNAPQTLLPHSPSRTLFLPISSHALSSHFAVPTVSRPASQLPEDHDPAPPKYTVHHNHLPTNNDSALLMYTVHHFFIYNYKDTSTHGISMTYNL
ncbi:uncharacterized protein LOC118438784 [Folsomia candida]|nr:uncharacterized protein LOC118438784 [Folsomia candida]